MKRCFRLRPNCWLPRITLRLHALFLAYHGTARALGIQHAFDSGEQLADRLRTLGTHQSTGVWLQNSSNNGSVSQLGYGQAEVQHSTSGMGADTALDVRWVLGISAAHHF